MTHLAAIISAIGIYQAYVDKQQNVATVLQTITDTIPDIPEDWECPAEYVKHFYKLKLAVGNIDAVLPLLTAYAKRVLTHAYPCAEFDMQMMYGLKLHAIAGLCSCWLSIAHTKPEFPKLLENLRFL